ncbi:MAG: hypothetical protein ABI347_05110 [Nitrososphaera sp.]|jgi:hypothetical protein
MNAVPCSHAKTMTCYADPSAQDFCRACLEEIMAALYDMESWCTIDLADRTACR